MLALCHYSAAYIHGKLKKMELFTDSEKKLIELLRSKGADEDAMFIPETLHGFFIGLAISPILIMPGKWISFLFDENNIDFDSEEEVKRMMEGVFSLYNRINSKVSDESFRFPFDYSNLNKDVIRRIDDWVYGLSKALRLGIGGMFFARDDFDYEKANDEEKNIFNSYGVVMTAANTDDIIPILDEMPDEKRENITKAHVLAGLYSVLPLSVTKIYEYSRKNDAQFTRMPEKAVSVHRKVGRNEPCPCGSGKKYKNCCGLN